MPTERPLIPKDYELAPEIPCTGTSAAFYLPVLTFHSINETQYNAMIAGIQQPQTNVPYLAVMNQTIDHSDANCEDKMVQITINEDSDLQIILVSKHSGIEYKSCLPLSLFKGFKLLLESINGFDEEKCTFHFKKGECTYLRPANTLQQVVVFTISYHDDIIGQDVIIGHFDVSTPPPVIN